jgi:hypothetical protein
VLSGGVVAAASGLPGRGPASAAARLWMRAHTMLGVSRSGRLSACTYSFGVVVYGVEYMSV